jgi:hypothetical protein
MNEEWNNGAKTPEDPKVQRLRARLGRTEANLRRALERAELAERSAADAWKFAKMAFRTGRGSQLTGGGGGE